MPASISTNAGGQAPAPPSPGQRYQPLVPVLAAFCLGILLDRQLGLPLAAWWLLAVLTWLGWSWFWKRGALLAPLLLLAAVMCVGGGWRHLHWRLFGADELGLFSSEQPQPSAIEAIALTRPRRIPAPEFDPLRAIPASDQSRLSIRVVSLRDGDIWRRASGRATLIVQGHLLNVQAGDRIRVFGALADVQPAANPGEFDFAQHARGDRELCLVRSDFPDCVETLERGGPSWRRLIERVRTNGSAILTRYVAPDQAGLAAAVLLGAREHVDDEQTEAFMTTGTIHVLSISGLHVGLLSLFLLPLLRAACLPRRVALIAVILITTCYTLVTGAEPPAVRATVMVAITCGAMLLGNRALGMNSLAAAALVVLWSNPADLFRVGTQLSFLSMACLVWLGPRWREAQHEDPLQRLIRHARPWPLRITDWLSNRLLLATCASAVLWMVTAPLVATQFHIVSWAARGLNTLLALPVFVAMVSGFAAIVLDGFSQLLAELAGGFCGLSLRLLARCIVEVDALRGSHFWTPGPQPWWLIGFYGGLLLFVLAPQWRPPRRWLIAVLAGWLAVGMGASWRRQQPAARLECEFVAVGHGCSVILQTPRGETLLYDAGRLGSPAGGARSIAACLWSRGVTHIDALILSHADVDHYNAVPELLERFSVGVIYVSPVMFEHDTPALRELADVLQSRRVPLREVFAGDRLLTGGGLSLEVLYPPRRGTLGSDNANSIVLAVDFAGKRILLTGDLEPPGLDDVIAEQPLDCDLILAPHHASRGSEPEKFAAWSTPEHLVISGGHSPDVVPVAAVYAQSGARPWHTAELGAITASIAADGQLTVAAFRGGPQAAIPRPELDD